MRDEAPRVYEWVARTWNAKATRMDLQAPLNDFSHPGWKFIFEDICRTYLPYLYRHALAWQKGEPRFDFETRGVTYPALPVVHHRVWYRDELQRRFQELPEEAKGAVQNHLAPFGGLHALLKGGTIPSGLAHEFILPLEKRKRPLGLLRRLGLRFAGTPWDMPK